VIAGHLSVRPGVLSPIALQARWKGHAVVQYA